MGRKAAIRSAANGRPSCAISGNLDGRTINIKVK
jgi:hypothetical protein